MTDRVTVRVLREHFGDLGQQAHGARYDTGAAHAHELAAQGLVEIVGPAADLTGKAEAVLDNKAEAPVVNKAAAPARKRKGR